MHENGGRPLAAVFASPGKYIQGAGAAGRIGPVLEQIGSSRPLILGDPIVDEIMGGTLDGIPGATRVEFGGECSPEEIDRVAQAASEGDADAVVGIGGGKTIDAAKAVAHPAGLPLVVVPTIASTDAPTSSLSVVYDEDGAFKEYRFFGKNPTAVVVDTAVVAQAPVRFLVAGIGDGLSTYFEADASSRTRKETMAGGAPTLAALAIARLCYDTLLEHGLAARLAVERHAVTPAVEKVAFGVISMLMLEERPAEVVAEVVDFCLEVGLPVALEDIGLDDVSREDLEKVAEAACIEGETIHNMPFEVHPPMVVDAMLAADAYGHQRRALLAGEAALPEVAQ